LAALHFTLYLQPFHAVSLPVFQKHLRLCSTTDNIPIVVIVVIASITFPKNSKSGMRSRKLRWSSKRKSVGRFSSSPLTVH